VRRFLLQNLVKVPEGWARRLKLEALPEPQTDITGFPLPVAGGAYPGPTHFIWGELSNYGQPAYEGAIQRVFPNGTMCAIANAGHWVYTGQPQGLADCMQRFLPDR